MPLVSAQRCRRPARQFRQRPQALLVDVVDTMGRYGRLVLQTHPAHGLIMVSRDRAVLEEVLVRMSAKPARRSVARSDSTVSAADGAVPRPAPPRG